MTTVKKIITKLQIIMKQKFPHFDGRFYANRRNSYIHLGLDKSLFSFADYKDFLNEIDKFLSEHLKTEFKLVDPPKLVISTQWNYLNYMATSSSKIYTNAYIPEYVADNLKWYERDGLDTWYKKNKCNEFLEDTDQYFNTAQIVNFDIIRNHKSIKKNKLEQYQTVNHEKIKMCPSTEQVRITSSIFRNIDRPDLHVNPELVKSHFKNTLPKKSVGRGRFLKICRDTMYAKYW